jgi:hypothetical protein
MALPPTEVIGVVAAMFSGPVASVEAPNDQDSLGPASKESAAPSFSTGRASSARR